MELEEETTRKKMELEEETKRKELEEETKQYKTTGVITTQQELTKRAIERTKQMEVKKVLADKNVNFLSFWTYHISSKFEKGPPHANDVPARHATEAALAAPKKRGRPKGSGKHQKAAREREAEAAKPFQPPHYSENWVANDRPMRGRPSSPVAEDQS